VDLGAVARERAAARGGGSSASSASASSSQLQAGPGSKTNNPQSIFNTPRIKTKKGGGPKMLGDGLLDAEDEFVPKAHAALVEVFRRFDSTHAGATTADAPDDSLCWTVADIQRFALATNGRPFSNEELMEITENLTHDEQGRLTTQGYVLLCSLRSLSRTHRCRINLAATTRAERRAVAAVRSPVCHCFL